MNKKKNLDHEVVNIFEIYMNFKNNYLKVISIIFSCAKSSADNYLSFSVLALQRYYFYVSSAFYMYAKCVCACLYIEIVDQILNQQINFNLWNFIIVAHLV